MANWKFKIDLKDIWKWFEEQGEDAKYDEEKVTELGKKVSSRIKQSFVYIRFEEVLEPICDQFESVTDIDDFDSVLSELYDFGDTGHTCWIATF
jgi:hypothetical protein